jgi:hypothetical protein
VVAGGQFRVGMRVGCLDVDNIARYTHFLTCKRLLF